MNPVEFFIGKGGVGKSTCSSLRSVWLASQKKATLLDSMDPAHNLHDIFETSFSGKSKKVSDFLWVRETDLDKLTRSYLKNIRRDFAGLYHYQQALNIDKYFKILKFAPGMEEYAAWLALESYFVASSYQHIVVDTPPTALTLKTLALGAVNLLWLEQLENMRVEILKKKNVVARIRKEDYSSSLQDDPVFSQLQKMKNRYQTVQKALQNPEKTCINLVLNEDELSFSESVNIKNGLAELAIPISRVLINKSTGNAAWQNEVREEFSPAEILCMPSNTSSIKGFSYLEKLSQQFMKTCRNQEVKASV